MDNVTYDRRIIAQAYAILQRAKGAGIPEQYLRIDKNSFSSLLSPLHYDAKNKEKLCNFVYDNANIFSRVNNILIDGGNITSRKMAGFALLFRIMACDKTGLYKECVELQHKFQTIRSTEDISRNDLVDAIKEYDALFLGEFHPSLFTVHFDSGTFFDELFSYRVDNCKQSIISFQDPIDSINIADKSCGNYLADFSKAQFNKNIEYSEDVKTLIIKVKAV